MITDLTTKEPQAPIHLSLIHDRKPVQYWAVSEYRLSAQLLYLGIDKLDRVTELRVPRNNSEFQRWLSINPNTPVTVTILALGPDRIELTKWMANRLQKMGGNRPICNLVGIDTRHMKRMIECSDGRRFEDQVSAARALGASQSAISQHLRGLMPTVKGHILYYVDSPRTLPLGNDAPANFDVVNPRQHTPNTNPTETPYDIAMRGGYDDDETN